MRIANSADLLFYNLKFIGFPIQMQTGDIILDNPTGTRLADGKAPLFYSTINTTFAAARTGCNIWFDGDTLGTIYDFRFTNGGGGTEFTKSNISNPVTFMPIPGTQVKFWRNTSSNNGYTCLILDIKYWRMWGENNAYTGLRDGAAGKKSLRGTFGFWISGDKQLTSAHALSVDSIDGGWHEIIGVEVEHHFSAVRTTGGSYNRHVTPILRRSYLHDGITGEGCYWGATHGYPFAALVGPIIEDCIIARRAAESVQIQHLINNPGSPARIRRNVVKDGAIDYVNAFQPYQDSGLQASIEGGENYFEQNIVDEGAASNTFVCYSDTGYAGEGSNDGKVTMIRNNLFLGGDIFLYVNISTVHGVKWTFKDNTIGAFRGRYTEDSGEAVRDYIVGSNNGKDTFAFINNTFDTTKTNVYQNAGAYHRYNNSVVSSHSRPQYKNSGFKIGERPVKWDEFWGNYHPNVNGTRFTCYVDRVYINVVDGQEYKFYKCLLTHAATAANRPDLYGAGFMVLTWDTEGIRNDMVGHNSGTTQSFYPPDLLFLVADDVYNKMDRGLYGNELNTDHTQIQWFRYDDSFGTNPIAIPRGKTKHFTPDIAEGTKWLRRGIRVKDPSGNFGVWNYSNFIQVSL